MMKKAYSNQVQLLVRLLSYVRKEESLALKGGTAINLFLRDMPRLSIDLDLVYLPIQDRATSLKNISDSLDRIRHDVERNIPKVTLKSVSLPRSNKTIRLIAASPQGTVKVEVSPVLRGSVFGSEPREITPVVAEQFGFARANLMAVPDILAGKMCAALDRQHPRDIFDVQYIMEADRMDNRLHTAFLVYLVSHNRPISELLDPNEKELGRASRYRSHQESAGSAVETAQPESDDTTGEADRDSSARGGFGKIALSSCFQEIEMTIPEKPSSRLRKNRLTDKIVR